MSQFIRPFDRDAVREQYGSARPFPYFVIEDFLAQDFLQAVINAYPSYGTARNLGREFDAVNEKRKIQVTDSTLFPAPVKQLAELLCGEVFLRDIEYITGIQNLVADPLFNGGGMHLSGSSGRLDVHVDFNFNEESALFRRLNILLYLNPVWNAEWGGNIELWDRDVSRCEQSYGPVANRCLVFETSEISYHGVTPIKCPPEFVRKSFAAYYYTKAAPASWDGDVHSTIFRARPDEKFRGKVLMPAEGIKRDVQQGMRRAKEMVKRILGR